MVPSSLSKSTTILIFYVPRRVKCIFFLMVHYKCLFVIITAHSLNVKRVKKRVNANSLEKE